MKQIIFLSLLLLVVGCKKHAIVFDGEANDNFELPLVLSFNGVSCALDDDRSRLKYCISAEELEDFNPLVAFQEYADVTFNGQVLKNGEINDLVELELHALYVVSIKVPGKTRVFQLEFSNLPIIQIVVRESIRNEPKALSKITVIDPESSSLAQTDWMGLEQRGASSLQTHKKSFGFELYMEVLSDETVKRSYFDMPASSNWVINAMPNDKARLRNKASFELWNQMNSLVPSQPITFEFVEVYVNQTAHGLHCLTQKYGSETLNTTTTSSMVEAVDNSDFTKFYAAPSNPPVSAKWEDWEQKIPHPNQTIDWSSFPAFVDLVDNASDADFKAEISQQVDLDNMIDYFLLINVLGATDNMGKNMLFFKESDQHAYKLLPWDLDATWGRHSFGQERVFYSFATNGLFERLKETNPNDYKSKVVVRWNELRANIFSKPNLIAVLESNFEELEAWSIVAYENEIWEESLDMEAEKAFILAWLEHRVNWLDQQFAVWE